jgi:hypothetical protein
MCIESQLFELKRHIEAAGVIAPSSFHWLSVDRWRPLRSAAGCSRTLPGGGVRRRARRGWHVIAKCEDGNSGHHDPDDKCRQEPSAAVSVTERSLSVGVQAWIGLLRLSELSVGRLAIDHLFPLPVVPSVGCRANAALTLGVPQGTNVFRGRFSRGGSCSSGAHMDGGGG